MAEASSTRPVPPLRNPRRRAADRWNHRGARCDGSRRRKDIGAKAISYAEKNVQASRTMRSPLLTPRICRIMKLHSEYVQSQMRALAEQAADGPDCEPGGDRCRPPKNLTSRRPDSGTSEG